MSRIPLGSILVTLAGAFAALPASARVLLETDRALELAFGEDAEIRRVPVFLTEQQLATARESAGKDIVIPGALVTRYEGWKNGANEATLR